MSFYRTYRPQSISEIDNLSVREVLTRLLVKPKKDLPHAFFLSGPRGAGKTTAARVIAKIFTCEHPDAHGPCGVCEQCVSISLGKNLDVLEIDAASNRGIDEIRSLRDAVAQSPVSADYRIYIIDEVHMLTTEAFNALLKTLEEPPAHAVFILATTDPQKVPVTILSRTTPIQFSKASPEEIRAALARIIEKEKIHIDDSALTSITTHVDGSFRDAVKNLEQVSFSKGVITVETVQNILSMSDSDSVTHFVALLKEKNVKEAMKSVDILVQSGKDIKTFVVECLNILEKQLVSMSSSSLTSSASDTLLCIRKLTQAFVEMKSSPISQMPLELAIVEYCMDIPSGENREVRKEAIQDKPSQSHRSSSVSSFTSSLPSSETRSVVINSDQAESVTPGSLTVEKLVEHWPDIIAALKVQNHSVAGVMRSTRPKTVANGIVTIEAFFTFHREKLSESKTKDILTDVFRRLFGEKVKVDIVLGKK